MVFPSIIRENRIGAVVWMVEPVQIPKDSALMGRVAAAVMQMNIARMPLKEQITR